MYPHKFHVSVAIPEFVQQYKGLEAGVKYVYVCVFFLGGEML